DPPPSAVVEEGLGYGTVDGVPRDLQGSLRFPDALDLLAEEAAEEAEPEPDPTEYSELQERRRRLAAIDADLAAVHASLPPRSTLLVAGISVEAGASSLNAALLHGPGPDGTD